MVYAFPFEVIVLFNTPFLDLDPIGAIFASDTSFVTYLLTFIVRRLLLELS